MRRRAALSGLAVMVLVALPAAAAAQSTADGVLSFVLAPRSISTGDSRADAAAVTAVHDALADSLDVAAWLPAATSGGGFAFRPDSTLGGVAVRSSSSFGGFLTDRSLTTGRGRTTFGVHFRHLAFDSFDGRDLRDGTLVAMATRLSGEAAPIDRESLTLRINADVTTLAGTYGVSDRLDVTALVPLVRVSIDGQRVDTYRGESSQVSAGAATASGTGDIQIRGKYNLFRSASTGASLTAALRLPTGREEDFLGRGETTIRPGVTWSFEQPRVAVDASFGVEAGSDTRNIAYGGAVTFGVAPRLVVVGEVAGRRVNSAWHLEQSVAPRPGSTGVDILRLTATEGAAQQMTMVGGVKWNVLGSCVVSGNVMRRLTMDGLTASWVPSLALEYVFAR